MTTKNLYSCYDEVADTWNDPFADFTDGSALRSFTDFVLANRHKLSTVRDLTLYRIGNWDGRNGQIAPDRYLVASARTILAVPRHEDGSQILDDEPSLEPTNE